MPYGSSTVKKISFWLILICVTFLMCEIGARLVFAYLVGPKVLLYGTGAYRTEVKRFPSVVMEKVGYTPPTPESHRFWGQGTSYTKFSPHELKTDRDENGKRFHPTINSRGFRGQEFAENKERGIIRVVTLGASSTFGYHNRDEQTYPYYMEVFLNAAAKGSQKFEVINLGIPHMDSAQILSIFLNEALPLRPDVVTFYEGYNDTGIGPATAVRDEESSPEAALTFGRTMHVAFTKFSLVAALADSLLYYAGEIQFDQDSLHLHMERQSVRFVAAVSAINQVCRRNNILFVVGNQQSRSRLVEKKHVKGITFRQEAQMVKDKLVRKGKLKRREAAFLVHSSIMKSLARWTEKSKVPFVDVIRALDADRSVLLTYVHPNARGNRIIAEEFTRVILCRLNRLPCNSRK